MVQYQSFPGAAGDSRSLDKLKALRLPVMSGARFLDVGCNEGFFCGFARFQGAQRAVGIDASRAFIERARARFPDCEFHAQDWSRLPEGEFDVILLASALHYADDQPALIERLLAALSPDGVLVMEVGIARSGQAVWQKVARDADERLFPSMPMLREVLKDHAWKWMGPSILQDGDPIPRHVIHVRRRRPVAFLLMEPPGMGKSSIAARLSGASALPVVSNDLILNQLASGKLQTPATLAEAARGFSAFELDQVIASVIEAGLIGELVDLWCAQGGDRDFLMDGFVPSAHQNIVQQLLRERGYLPVRLSWDRVGLPPPSAEQLQEQADSFYLSLASPQKTSDEAASEAPAAITGFVDELDVRDGRLVIRGWVVGPDGGMPRLLAARINGGMRVFSIFERQQRPDVQRHFKLRHDLLGFRLSVEWAQAGEEGLDEVAVYGGDEETALSAPFQRAAAAGRRSPP